MNKNEQLMNMIAAARAAMADRARSTIVGVSATPRFELFHAASSLCSQKVRTVLTEKQLSYRSNDMRILGSMGADGLVPAEHYDPAYVRLRLLAGRELERDFVNGYSGRTSVESEGFDPCVVPLLVDHHAGRVIADSLRICCYLDDVSPLPHSLLPADPALRAEVMRQARIVDRIPNGALLYGFHPDGDLRPEMLKNVMQTVYDVKIRALQAKIDANANDAELVAAYRAKIAKESGGKLVSRVGDFQRRARAQVGVLLADLERDLMAGSAPYLNGHDFSLADLFWGVNLVRIAYLGQASLWQALPHVAHYVALLSRRPSLCQEAIGASIASMPPSPFLDALMPCMAIEAA
jgi:glutathione S-transferase